MTKRKEKQEEEICANLEEQACECGCGGTNTLEDLQNELTEQKSLYLRLAAEFDNFKKRTEREKTMIYSDAFVKAVTELLPVVDNLERALAVSADGKDFDGLYTGVDMILKQTIEIFSKMSVEEIQALNMSFDPELHNAVMHTEDENLPENTVSEVLQKGYRMNDRVVRHAVVKVAN